MRPYKKRSFYNHLQSNGNSPETENSDDSSEKQLTPPPAIEDAEKEKDKDKEGEIKNRKKWKRKISRKQFRHHDIKIFTPGEYRSSTFLRHKDSNPTISRKPDVASKESITESIVSSLGGQKQAFTQNPMRAEDSIDHSKNDAEENNNTNTMQNHNNTGKHQLPAIIIETPTVRRRSSLESIHIPKTAFTKIKDQTKTITYQEQSIGTKIPGDMPLLQHLDVIEKNSVSSTQTSIRNGDLPPVSEAVHNAYSRDTNNGRMDWSDGLMGNNPEPRSGTTAVDYQNSYRGEEQVNKAVSQLQQKRQSSQTMETEHSVEPENLSVKRRYSSDAPVDLSKKSSSTQHHPIISPSHFQKANLRVPVSSSILSGPMKTLTFKPTVGASYFQHPSIEPNRASARNPFKKPSTVQSGRTENSGSYKQNNGTLTVDAMRIQKSYSDESTKIQKCSLQSPLANTAKAPPPTHYRKDYQPQPKNLFTDAVVRITNLNMWREVLLRLLGQQFTIPILDFMSHAYLQLDTIKNEPYVPTEVRTNAQKVLTDAYNLISGKLKLYGVDRNPTDVIKILGQAEPNPEKMMILSNLENIHRIRNLNLNDYSTPPYPQFSVPQKKAKNQKFSSELSQSSPPPFNYMQQQAANANYAFSKVPSPRASDVPISQRGHSDAPILKPPLKVNEQPVNMRHQRRNNMRTVDHSMSPVSSAGHHFGSDNSSTSLSLPREQQLPVLPPPNTYLNYTTHDSERRTFLRVDLPEHKEPPAKNHNSVGRPRSKSHKPTEVVGGHHQLKRSMSNPVENNYPLGYQYNIDSSTISQARIPTSQNAYFLSQYTASQNILLNNDLSITPNVIQRSVAPPSYSDLFPQTQMAKETNMYGHPLLEYSKKVPPNLHHLPFNENQKNATNFQNVPSQVQEIRSPTLQINHTTSHTSNRIEETISSTSDHVQVSKVSSIPKPQEYKENSVIDSRSPQPNEHPKILPAVIVADTSMQITKEPTLPPQDSKIQQDLPEDKDLRMTVITSSTQNVSCSAEKFIFKRGTEKDQDENNSEFLDWLEKLKKNDKLKSKFLCQMGIVKKEEPIFCPAGDCIEIIDSDEENIVDPKDTEIVKGANPVPVPAIKEPTSTITRPSPSQEYTEKQASITMSFQEKIAQQENNTTITVPCSLEVTPVPPISKSSTIRNKSNSKQSLSKLDYIPPIALPYVPTSTVYGGKYQRGSREQKKPIYSPEIEPISPVGNEPSFAFPEVSSAAKIRPPPVTINVGDKGVVLRKTLSSPTYIQKRKTPLGFADNHSDESISSGHNSAEYSSDNASKRRKSLDRPQTAISPRVPPSGKLCYVRESHMFLRYFDDTQVELFIKNMSSQHEELIRTTGIDPEKIKNSYKHSNFGIEQLGKTEILHLPRDIEFSRKEDLQDVEEFVKESNLVERFVPKDFADFYRYVTGFQIIKNKHPVSLQTFLTMFNTNRTTELLRKYLQRRDEDLSGVIAGRTV